MERGTLEITVTLETRNADIRTLAAVLQEQDAAKVDLVTPIVNVRSTGGIIRVAGTSVFGDGQTFRPTEIADNHFAEKLGIPVTYLRRLRAARIDLYDQNVNGWIHGLTLPDDEDGIAGSVLFPQDLRTVTLRTFQGEPGEEGVLRAVLSDRFGVMDNLDVALAALDALKESGINTHIVGCDLSETRMCIKISAPDVFASAPQILEDYRSPFRGKNLPEWAQKKFGVDGNGMFAGLVITNGETGGSAFNITPRITTLICMNGAMATKDAIRKVHVGKRLEAGVVDWSSETQQKALELITAQTKDAVRTFLSQEYLDNFVAGITAQAVKPVTNPEEQIKVISKTVGFTEAQAAGILAHFIQGGQLTAGGVFQATTSYAQTLENADQAYDMEAAALRVLELAAA